MICRHQLKEILQVDGRIEVVGEGSRGEEALTLLEKHQPDLLVVDLVMPGQGGQETIALVMARHPVPILVLTAQPERVRQVAAFDAIRRGALDLAEKPHRGDREAEERLRRSIRTLAGVAVVRHMAATQGAAPARLASRDATRSDRAQKPRPEQPGPGPALPPDAEPHSGYPTTETPAPKHDHPSAPPESSRPAGGPLIVGIGASAGGPAPLATLLAGLPSNFPAAVAVVQHLPIGFADGFAEYLRGRISMEVRKVEGRERIRPGLVYVAADDRHLVAASAHSIESSTAPALEGHRPAVDALFSSLARLFGPRACGVILSGIGQDGTRGLLEMRERGAALTLAQSEESCAVFGMPQAALSSGAARLALSPVAMVQELLRFAGTGAAGRAAP
jgi:two-component system chemotaxis response regulator CheB